MSVSDIAVGLPGDSGRADKERLDVTGEHTDDNQAAALVTRSTETTRPRDAHGWSDDQAKSDAQANPLIASLTDATSDFRRWSRAHIRFLNGSDALVGIGAVLLGALLASDLSVATVHSWVVLAAVGAMAWPLLLGSMRGYQRRRSTLDGEIVPVLRAAALAVILCALPTAWFSVPGLVTSVGFGAPAAAVASAGVRVISRQRLLHRQRTGKNLRQVLVVGSPDPVQDLCDAITQERAAGMHVVGVCTPAADRPRAQQMGLPVVGDIDHAADVATRLDCHEVAVAGADATGQRSLRRLAWSLEGTPVELLVHPGLFDVARTRMHIQGYPSVSLLHVEQPHFSGWRKTIKRATDVLFAALGVVFISPLLAAISLTIRLSDPHGPVFFRQRRVGIDGKSFTMYKFRTMVPDAETRREQMAADNEGAGPLFKMQQDPRVTRAGRLLRRYSLDELPQLFNVLGGSMSLVGPRPALQSEVDTYAEHIRRRLKVTPGLTGLWQISGRSTLSWNDSVRLDLRYVENWSIGLDLEILIKTGHAVLAKKGAF